MRLLRPQQRRAQRRLEGGVQLAVEERHFHHVKAVHRAQHEVQVGRPKEGERAAAQVRRVGVRRRLVRARVRVRVRVRVGLTLTLALTLTLTREGGSGVRRRLQQHVATQRDVRDGERYLVRGLGG